MHKITVCMCFIRNFISDGFMLRQVKWEAHRHTPLNRRWSWDMDELSHGRSIVLCQKDVTTLLTQWSYVFLALKYRYGIMCAITSPCPKLSSSLSIKWDSDRNWNCTILNTDVHIDKILIRQSPGRPSVHPLLSVLMDRGQASQSHSSIISHYACPYPLQTN